jgi:hypothetical protein
VRADQIGSLQQRGHARGLARRQHALLLDVLQRIQVRGHGGGVAQAEPGEVDEAGAVRLEEQAEEEYVQLQHGALRVRLYAKGVCEAEPAE